MIYSYHVTTCRIQAPPAGGTFELGVGAVGGIIAAALLILFIIILLVISYRTRRLCFRKPDVVVREVDRKRADMTSMQCQVQIKCHTFSLSIIVIEVLKHNFAVIIGLSFRRT